MDNFLDNLIYEIAIMGVLRRIFRQDNFLRVETWSMEADISVSFSW